MPADQGEASAVIQEIHILASLEHPFIVRYYDSFIEERKLFLVMEYATHGSLHSVLQRHQKSKQHIDELTLWQYAIQLLLGLHSIHKLRILHRDLKVCCGRAREVGGLCCTRVGVRSGAGKES